MSYLDAHRRLYCRHRRPGKTAKAQFVRGQPLDAAIAAYETAGLMMIKHRTYAVERAEQGVQTPCPGENYFQVRNF
jgi:hypothetical protein